jgi:hypothetical protein
VRRRDLAQPKIKMTMMSANKLLFSSIDPTPRFSGYLADRRQAVGCESKQQVAGRHRQITGQLIIDRLFCLNHMVLEPLVSIFDARLHGCD